jgi:GNAT superfamily N-acetyltransferase
LSIMEILGMSNITVRAVQSKEDAKAHFEFPWKVFKDNPYWVPPLKSMRKKEMDRQHAAAWEYMEGENFIAERNGEVVGIITAFVNKRHNATWHEETGWFGDFHFIDDAEVCRALLQKAEEYIKAKGMKTLRGPATFTLHAECGVLMSAYDKTPILLMPYNHPYYPKHIESAGYGKAMDLVNWHADNTIVESDQNAHFVKLNRVVQKNNERRKITVRIGEKKDRDKDFQLIQELYNSAWEENWGFVPLTERELEELIHDLKDFYEPSMTFFAFVDGKPAGYLLAIPDLNQAIHRAYPKPGTPEPITLAKILYHWKIRPVINGIRVPLMGVKREFHQMGVDGALLYEGMAKARAVGMKHFYGGWVLETNSAMNQVCENLGAHIDRTYRIYEKSL